MPLRIPNLGHPLEEHRLGMSREVYGESLVWRSGPGRRLGWRCPVEDPVEICKLN